MTFTISLTFVFLWVSGSITLSFCTGLAHLKYQLWQLPTTFFITNFFWIRYYRKSWQCSNPQIRPLIIIPAKDPSFHRSLIITSYGASQTMNSRTQWTLYTGCDCCVGTGGRQFTNRVNLDMKDIAALLTEVVSIHAIHSFQETSSHRWKASYLSLNDKFIPPPANFQKLSIFRISSYSSLWEDEERWCLLNVGLDGFMMIKIFFFFPCSFFQCMHYQSK